MQPFGPWPIMTSGWKESLIFLGSYRRLRCAGYKPDGELVHYSFDRELTKLETALSRIPGAVERRYDQKDAQDIIRLMREDVGLEWDDSLPCFPLPIRDNRSTTG